MRNIFKSSVYLGSDIQMYDQNSFYEAFQKDLLIAQDTVIIESPFITTKRISDLLPTLLKLVNRGVQVIINTRNPIEHDGEYKTQALDSIETLQSFGINVLYSVKHHRKVALIDNRIVWNGSLNILSQNDSCELMWRIDSSEAASKLLGFINIKAYTRR